MPARSPASIDSGTATVVSWSVTARTETPAVAAACTRSAGASVPSERVVWLWRSTDRRTEPQQRSWLGGRGGNVLGICYQDSGGHIILGVSVQALSCFKTRERIGLRAPSSSVAVQLSRRMEDEATLRKPGLSAVLRRPA